MDKDYKLHLATTYGIMHDEITPQSICDIVADLFDFPCNYSPCEEELHDEPWKMDWCEKYIAVKLPPPTVGCITLR